jgi:di/tricarboxylate transporter
VTLHGWIALAVLAAAAVSFLTRVVPIGVTALSIPVALFLTGAIPEPAVALQGFGNHAVIALGAVFVVGAGLEKSGVAGLLAHGVQKVGGRSEVALILLTTVTVAVLSAFMSNAATAAVLIPAVVTLARRAGLSPSRLLMPLAFGCILGGNLTLIGTAPNLLVSNYLFRHTGRGFGMFDFALVGAPIVAAGILYLVTIGRRLLPARDPDDRRGEARDPENLARSYGLNQTLFQVRVTPQSELVGRSLADADIGRRYGLAVVFLVRPGNLGRRYVKAEPSLEIRAGDHLYLRGADEAAWLLAEEQSLQIGLAGEHNVQRLLRHGITFAEVTLSPRSSALGKSLKELEFRRAHGLNVVSLWRRGQPVEEGIAYTPLEIGDFLLVSGSPSMIRRMSRDPDYVVMAEQAVAAETGRAPLAIGLLLVAVLPPLLGLAPLAMSALIAALLMVVTGCVTARRAQQAIDWPVLMLIVGTLPLGHALEVHGVAREVAGWLLAAVEILGGGALLALLFLAAALVSVTSSNAAAAVVLAPIAANAAEVSGVELRNALLAVAYGCSCAFLVPFAHQCNLMVMGPGGYRNRDYLVVGGGLSVVVTGTAVVLLSLL